VVQPKPIRTGELDAQRLFEGFENLMPFRVQDILLVSSLYDSFILREDGRLNELLLGESLELNLWQVPGITHVSSGAEALAMAKAEPRFNLIIANLQLSDMDAAELARQVKAAGLDVPVVVLAYDYREIKNFRARNPETDIHRIFLWQGNVRILIAIVKYVEDERNVRHDTEVMGVPVILVVEDNIRYYSAFLPLIYTELIEQSRGLISEGLNVAHKLVRMRARPKILLSTTYEDAVEKVLTYQDYLLGVVSDIEFPKEGVLSPDSGFDLARMVRSVVEDAPIVLQSSRTQFMPRAAAEDVSFLRKRSPTLLLDLRRYLIEQFSFGDFVFRLPDRSEVARAKDLNALERLLHEVPVESVLYHSERNHFSRWLRARTEFALAQKLRPRRVSDFADGEALRRDIIESIAEYRAEQSGLLIGDFQAATFKASEGTFLRLGGGSLGGKARGLAFVRHLLHKNGAAGQFPGVRIAVPATLVLATDIFDEFLSENELADFAIRCDDDAEIVEQFRRASLPGTVVLELLAYLEQVQYPLAVRSSSLLEDSQYQPFTGVYQTFMLPNQDEDIAVRMEQLMDAIKRVYASTFSRHAKAYIRATPYRLEEEKMAVVVQRVVGEQHGARFYPDISGVLRSRNFYPLAPSTSEDGIATVALGLGRAVVDGGKCLMFSPRYPQNLVQFSSVHDMLTNSQSEFWAIDMSNGASAKEKKFTLPDAERDGTLRAVASTYSADNDAIYDGMSRPGARVVSFAPVLKYGRFPLAPVLESLMNVGEQGLAKPVEIEFAVRLAHSPSEVAEFGFLQMRPLVLSRETAELKLDEVDPTQVLCRSSNVLGNGKISDIQDVVVVDFHRFERARSFEVAEAVSYFNSKLNQENRPYLLIGVGRWGSNDPWLGIPVEWDQVSGARVIVEAGFRDFRVTPSQGSHFFQNLTAFQVGYFTVNPDAGEGSMDWEWLAEQSPVEERDCVRQLRFETPLEVVMSGRENAGVVRKPLPR